jgi:hypothetical protein
MGREDYHEGAGRWYSRPAFRGRTGNKADFLSRPLPVWERRAQLRLARWTQELEPEGAASRGRPFPPGRRPGNRAAVKVLEVQGDFAM